MSRGPGIHEIFSKTQRKNGAFTFEGQESKQQLKLSKEVTAEATSPMKKFGGYKPKILGGEMDFLEIQENSSTDTSKSILAARSPPFVDQLQDKPSHMYQPMKIKPWVIGDKDTPMVLGSSNVDDDDDIEPHISDSSIQTNDIHSNDYNSGKTEVNSTHRTLSVSSDTSTLVRQNSDDSRQGIDNPVLYSNGFISVNNSTTPALDTSIPDFKTNTVNTDDTLGVYIPPPDYDEDEKTLDFNSEDTDDPSDGGEDIKTRQSKPKTAVKVYEGADLSHYLSEEDAEQEVILRNAPRTQNMMGRKSDNQGPKVQEKKSLFKQFSPNKSKRKSNGSAPKFNSVRSFSYADSKFGTSGKALGKSFSASNLGDDSDRFLNANTQESSYESFLRSRHGDDLPSDSRNVGGDNKVGKDYALKHKDDPVWKKLTLRLKKKLSKDQEAKEP